MWKGENPLQGRKETNTEKIPKNLGGTEASIVKDIIQGVPRTRIRRRINYCV